MFKTVVFKDLHQISELSQPGKHDFKIKGDFPGSVPTLNITLSLTCWPLRTTHNSLSRLLWSKITTVILKIKLNYRWEHWGWTFLRWSLSKDYEISWILCITYIIVSTASINASSCSIIIAGDDVRLRESAGFTSNSTHDTGMPFLRSLSRQTCGDWVPNCMCNLTGCLRFTEKGCFMKCVVHFKL